MMRHVRLVAALAGRGLREMARMPGILAVIFLPGMGLYAVFTLVLPGGGSGGGLPRMHLALVDEDRSPASHALAAALEQMSVSVRRDDGADQPLTQPSARTLVERGKVSAALVIPAGYGGNLFSFEQGGPVVELVIDETQPAAGNMLEGMLEMAAGMALFQMMDDALVQATGRRWLGSPPARATSDVNTNGSGVEGKTSPSGILRVQMRGVNTRRDDDLPPSSLLYLAGLVPMFLLFNASGAASTVLEELKNGATRRILAAPVHPGHYLCGHLVMSLVMCLLQVLSMYLLAYVAFRAPLGQHVGGLAALTIATSLATVGFAMLIASIARVPEQVHSIGTVVILIMSALGGSMFPRFFMPEWIRPLGLFTINGWAYDGFITIIRGQGIAGAATEIAVLTAIGAGLTTIAVILLTRRLRNAPTV
jgi:ABC-2 type transport system permease protein